MYFSPDDRRAWHPSEPEREGSKRGEVVMLWLVVIFLFAMLFAPIAGGTLIQALLAMLHR